MRVQTTKMRFWPRDDLRLVLADQPRAGRDQNAAAVEGIDVLGDDRPHLSRQVADDRRLQNAGDQRALRDEGVDALDLAAPWPSGRQGCAAAARNLLLRSSPATVSPSPFPSGKAAGIALGRLVVQTIMFERKRSGNSSGGGSAASVGGVAAPATEVADVELGRVDRLFADGGGGGGGGNSTTSGSAGSGCGSPSRTKEGGRKVVVVNSSSPSSMSRAGCC